MDKGAARSRKRAQQLEKLAQKAAVEASAGPSLKSTKKSKSKSNKNQGGQASEAGPSKPRPPPPQKAPKPVPEAQSRDPELYKPKAIRTSTALIWPFDLPPASLDGITRIDLTNSGVTNVDWIRGSGVRWLSLSGCQIDNWDVVGTLSELTVLNMNECGLKVLPESLGQLRKLKAFVAMNNPWKELDAGVISQWTELNSLIISHSPNLTTIPNLQPLIHLTKLTFSHCPRLTSASLPDLSSLPLLKDVKMNNLPLLTSLPSHLLKWGTGPMSQLSTTDSRSGLGLEALDVGSCSLDHSVLDLFKSARLGNIRSVTLHHNPMASAVPNYVEKLVEYGSMPKLQIVDNKRVVEKKTFDPEERKKSKKAKKNKDGKVKITGSNSKEGAKMREWGGKAEEVASGIKGVGTADESMDKDDGISGKKDKKRKRDIEASTSEGTVERTKEKRHKIDLAEKKKPAFEPKSTLKENSTIPSKSSQSSAAAAGQAAKTADPSALTSANAKRHSKNETGVYGVVEVSQAAEGVKEGKDGKAKGKKHGKSGKAGKDKEAGVAKIENGESKGSSGGGIDLKSMFAKSDDTGLGVGGW